MPNKQGSTPAATGFSIPKKKSQVVVPQTSSASKPTDVTQNVIKIAKKKVATGGASDRKTLASPSIHTAIGKAPKANAGGKEHTLQRIFQDAKSAASKAAEGDKPAVKRAVACLKQIGFMSITLEELQASHLGKDVKTLLKHPCKEVAHQATLLMEGWR
ncbi:hypothetical protein CYMTET_47529 [Cymbomonas tetramitiformis]|uniref:TFIIS N-terminal domain-containing protein n=1 Tax=Cymbomonas tetramitiformis TaxID=36881 RepID=A0AAE0BU47_9CHLO|nr:hypothetical protein CYMTET_47529 [Cymbomonas tetramitiformis]